MIALGLVLHSNAAGKPAGEVLANVRDYEFMTWLDGLRDPNFRIQTSRNVLNYHHPAFGPTAPRPPVSLSCQVTGHGGIACDPSHSGLETAAWQDRVSFVLRISPTAAVTEGSREMALDLPDGYRKLLTDGEVRALCNDSGAGFAILGSTGPTSVKIDAARAVVTAKRRSQIGCRESWFLLESSLIPSHPVWIKLSNRLPPMRPRLSP